ncbi:hypothetical protein IFM89_020818 [Coptis chinensis]|uniref:Pentatricopeptide repeat-containing protein n=1 Tax=Coptis chinensis TaxID=261450 RepID=A0A835IZQ1_9MAGN|nr:hypothetical protein IFM89_020818 [Coptis chinensis]
MQMQKQHYRSLNIRSLLCSRYTTLSLQQNPGPSSPSSSFSPWFPILQNSITQRNLPLGKCTHARIIRFGDYSNRFLTNNLINMYSKCGVLDYARKLFDQSPNRDLVTWNSILAGYAVSAETDDSKIFDGFCLFRGLRRCEELSPTRLTLAPVLKMALFSGCISISEAIHCYAAKVGLDFDVFISGILVNIYTKVGWVEEARRLFDEMPEKDVVMWNVMLKAYVQSGAYDTEVFRLFSEFHSSGLRPDDISVNCVLRELSKGVVSEELSKSIDQVRAYAVKVSLLNDVRDVFKWNKTMSEYVNAGENRAALECFLEMTRSNVECDKVTFVIALSSAMGTNDLKVGQQIQCRVVKSGFDFDISIANSLINMYAKMGCLNYALAIFSEMEELDLISWNSMISSCVQGGLGKESLNLFLDLLCEGLRPDQFTLASVLRACSSVPHGFYLGRQVHVHAVKLGCIGDVFVSTALIDVYGKSGRMEEAELVYKIREGFDLGSCNAMMAGYINNQDSSKALSLFSLIHKDGKKSDQFTLATAINACGSSVVLEQGKQIQAHVIKLGFDSDLCVSSGILGMYVKCGDMKGASLVFDGICEPDDVAWTAMISGCVENGDVDHALWLYHQMRHSGILPDEYTFATLIKACSCLTAFEQGKQIHANVIKLECLSDPFVGTSLIDMYAKCGSISESYTLFKRMNVTNIALWNAMMVGLAQHGNGEEALNLFREMRIQGVIPDKISFIGILSACSYSGLVSEAYGHFDSMYKDYGIEPEIEHYSCLVDVLARAGLLENAEKLISNMPFAPSASMYRALLGACWVQKNAEVGKRIASQLLALDPLDSSAYVLMSNIYAAANQWNQVADARKMMKTRNVKKDTGYSWIDVKNKVHLFVVDDNSHPQAAAVISKVEE